MDKFLTKFTKKIKIFCETLFHSKKRSEKYLVRVVFSHTKLENIKTLIKYDSEQWGHENSKTPKWSDETIEAVKDTFRVLGDPISTFTAKTDSPIDIGHCMGVIAATISCKDYSDDKKLKKGRACGTCIFESKKIKAVGKLEYTPENCTSFYPACEFHFDISSKHSYDGIINFFLEGIFEGTIPSFYIKRKEGEHPYSKQVKIAYDYCEKKFNPLDPDNPPTSWKSTKELSASQQIHRFINLPRSE